MGKVDTKRFSQHILFVFVFLFLLLISPRISHAACKCIATDSAALGITAGVWQSVEDGGPLCDTAGPYKPGATCNPYKEGYIDTPFCVPTLPELLSNLVRILFFVAGLLAIFMLLYGAFQWVASGGEEAKLKSARARILAAVIGLVVMVCVMTLIIVIEQVIFGGKVCLGVSCPLDMRKFVLVGDGSSYTGRPTCFGGRSAGTVASGSASLTTIPSRSTSPSTSPIKRPIRIMTATPGPSMPPTSTTPGSGSRVVVIPYGSVSGAPTPTPSKKIILPGTGGGGGGPLPTVPTL